MNKDVIVIGGNHHNTLAVLRSLGEKGLKVKLIVISADYKPYVCYSKYIERYLVINNEEDIFQSLYKLYAGPEKAIIIACADGVASYLDLHRNDLICDFILPCAKEEGRITYLMNKDIMARLAENMGIATPKSWIINNTSHMEIEGIEFPCIIKPLASANGSKSDISICDNLEQLRAFLKTCQCEELQIQKYISKEIEYQLIGCSLNGGEDIIIPGASIILRQPRNTNTGYLRYLPKNQFKFNEKACKDFLKATGYSGLFSMEFLRDKQGHDYFMEINFRNDGNSICVTASGMNLPYIWYLANTGQVYDSELCYDDMKSVFVMPEFNDVVNVIYGRISLTQWLKDVLMTNRFMEFSKHDQKPFWVYIYKKMFRL